MRDDVLDRQAAGSGLVFVADAFLVEAERAFAKHVRQDEFWAFFRHALEQTAHGILEVDALQRRGRGSLEPILTAYTRVSAILKVGSAAVCLPRDRHADFACVERFADHLAIAGQLVDDLEDVQEDLGDGRCNAAARVLVARVRPTDRIANGRIARAIVDGDRLRALLSLVEAHIAAARTALAPLRIAEAERFTRRIEQDMVRIRRELHRARVRAVFNPNP